MPVVWAGWYVFIAAHFAALALIRDWRVILLVLAFFGFWEDVLWGNVLTFVFVAAWLALGGSRAATLVFYALASCASAAHAACAGVAALAATRHANPFCGDLLRPCRPRAVERARDEWLARLLFTSGGEMLHESNYAPSRLIGAAWIPIGFALAAWLTWKGRVGLASLAVQPYLFPYYLLFGLLELKRSWANRPPAEPLGPES